MAYGGQYPHGLWGWSSHLYKPKPISYYYYYYFAFWGCPEHPLRLRGCSGHPYKPKPISYWLRGCFGHSYKPKPISYYYYFFGLMTATPLAMGWFGHPQTAEPPPGLRGGQPPSRGWFSHPLNLASFFLLLYFLDLILKIKN